MSYVIGYGITVRRRNLVKAIKTIPTSCMAWTLVLARTDWWPTVVGTPRPGCSRSKQPPFPVDLPSLLVRLVDDRRVCRRYGVAQRVGFAGRLRSGNRETVCRGRLGLLWYRTIVTGNRFGWLGGRLRFTGLNRLYNCHNRRR